MNDKAARRDAINRLGWYHYNLTFSGHAGHCCGSCEGEYEAGFGVAYSGDGCCCRDLRNGPRPTDDLAGTKIRYTEPDGYKSKAYIDHGYGDLWTGTDKFTGVSVTVRWNGTDWIQVG